MKMCTAKAKLPKGHLRLLGNLLVCKLQLMLRLCRGWRHVRFVGGQHGVGRSVLRRRHRADGRRRRDGLRYAHRKERVLGRQWEDGPALQQQDRLKVISPQRSQGFLTLEKY